MKTYEVIIKLTGDPTLHASYERAENALQAKEERLRGFVAFRHRYNLPCQIESVEVKKISDRALSDEELSS